MLQFIAEYNDKYSIAEQAQMAIEGGCKWVRLRVPDLDDANIRELAAELTPLCKETGTILTIEDHVELAKELGIHGVHIRHSRISPPEARELLGPEAIIGVEVEIAAQALALQGLDMDYVAFPAEFSLEKIGEKAEALRSEKFMLPIVADGDFDIPQAKEAMRLGANGVGIGKVIADARDPVAKTQEIIDALHS